MRQPYRILTSIAFAAALFAPLDRVASHGAEPMAAKRVADKEIERIVESLFQRTALDYDDEKSLAAAGSRATPYFVRALKDTKRVTARFGKVGDFTTPRSPLDRIVNLLSRDHLPDVVEPLVKLAELDDEDARKCAGLALGVLASETCIPPVLKLLGDRDEYVAGHTMIGIKRALQNERFDAEFMSRVFSALHDIVRKREASGDKNIPFLMLKIDRNRAVKSLVAADVLSIENRQSHYVLRALNDAQVKIDHKLLLPYLQNVKPLATKYPQNSAYAAALIAYGRNPDASADALLRAEIDHADDRVQAGAAEGFSALFGVTDALRFVYARQEELGFAGLSTPQQHYMAVFLCDAEVKNGGFSQYFVNSSAETWNEALAGYRAIGAVGRERLLQKALDLFGPKGPALDKRDRDEQRVSWSDEHYQTLDDLSSEYYKSKENVQALMARYAAAHHKHFHD